MGLERVIVLIIPPNLNLLETDNAIRYIGTIAKKTSFG
jgi:hypothetical protein